MKVAVLNNMVPFLKGGAEHLADSLVDQLRLHGHEAELYLLPFRWSSPLAVQESMLAAGLVDLHGVDRVVPLKFPAYLVPHEDKVPWLLHQFRQVYDLWDPALSGDPEWAGLRAQITASDNAAFDGCRRIYCNSSVTQDRLARFNSTQRAHVLHPPLGDTSLLRHESYGDYIFAAGRINGHKRQHLAVEAMAHVRSDVKLVVAGAPETPADLVLIEDLIAKHDLGRRVTVIPEFISEQVKADYYARALGAVYSPVDEDSYGYVTVEAYLSRKPVVTTTDSGGIQQLVRTGETGHVVEPTPEAMAVAFDDLADSPERAKALGDAGHDGVQALELTWSRVVEALTS